MRHRVATLGMQAPRTDERNDPTKAPPAATEYVSWGSPTAANAAPRHEASSSRSHYPFETGSAPIGHARL